MTLTRPGKYTVQARRVDTNHNVFQSNPVEFTVVPNPNYTPEALCTVSAAVTVTVSDPTGAWVENALVVFRPKGNSREPSRPQQLTTNHTGMAIAKVACGFADVFVAADGLTPYAQKVYLGHDQVPLKITLHPCSWMGR